MSGCPRSELISSNCTIVMRLLDWHANFNVLCVPQSAVASLAFISYATFNSITNIGPNPTALHLRPGNSLMVSDAMNVAGVLLLWVAFSLIGVVLSEGQCSSTQEEKVNACLQPMLNYASELQTSGLQFPVQGIEIFDKLCGLYDNFKKCVNPGQCSSISTEAIEASYGYMCGDGRALFAEHADCFAEVESQKDYLKCKNAATADINSLQWDAGNLTPYFTGLCSVMSSYLRCSHPIIDGQCGSVAWGLVSRVTEDSLSVTMPNCNLRPALA